MVFSPDLGGKNGGVLSMRMQVILDSPFARPGSAPIGGGKKGEFRDWTRRVRVARTQGNRGSINQMLNKKKPAAGDAFPCGAIQIWNDP